MKFLLDTHTLLWWLDDNPTLSSKAKAIISNDSNLIYVSAVSVWEIVIKKMLGKLEAPDNLEEVLQTNGFISLSISTTHALNLQSLPHHHQDPFDRLLIAQALVEDMTLITRDPYIVKYEVQVVEA